MEQATPPTDVMRTGQRMVLAGAAGDPPGLPRPRHPRGERTVVVLPLRVAGRTIGAINLSFPCSGAPGAAELDFLDVLADSCAQAFERIEATEVALTQTAGSLEFLAQASIELASSLDLDVTINRAARLAVPRFADSVRVSTSCATAACIGWRWPTSTRRRSRWRSRCR